MNSASLDKFDVAVAGGGAIGVIPVMLAARRGGRVLMLDIEHVHGVRYAACHVDSPLKLAKAVHLIRPHIRLQS